jgi:hypothetical protein
VTDIAFLFNGEMDEEWERGDREVVDIASLYVGVIAE